MFALRTEALPARILAVPVLGGALIDLPRLVRLGPITWLGILAVLNVAIGLALLVMAARYPRRLLGDVAPFATLLIWATATTLWTLPAPDAWPTWLSYVLIGVLVAAAGVATAAQPGHMVAMLDRVMPVYTVVGGAIAVVCFAERGFEIMRWMAHPRAVALAAIAPVAWHLARWAEGRARALLPVVFWIAVAIASLSRTASAVLVGLVVLVALIGSHGQLQGRRVGRRRLLLAAVVGASITATVLVQQFQARAFVDDRTDLWTRVTASALHAPIVGQGLGSSEAAPVMRYWFEVPPAVERHPNPYMEYWWVHPHNEYLRAWHDLGIPGVSLLIVALGWWAVSLFWAWRRLVRRDDHRARPILAALLALVALALVMLTDNPVVYPFVMAPISVVIGTGLGAALPSVGRTRRSRRRETLASAVGA